MNFFSSIPNISTEKYKGKTSSEIRKRVFEYYQNNYQGKVYLNEDLSIKINCTRIGGNKVSFGGTLYPKKACIIEALPYLLTKSIYNNFGQRKAKDNVIVLGYFNFKAQIYIDGKKENIRLSVQLRKDGKFYYNHEVNIY